MCVCVCVCVCVIVCVRTYVITAGNNPATACRACSNPDFADRVLNGWPLAPDAPMDVWYAPGPAGYTDFPPYKP